MNVVPMTPITELYILHNVPLDNSYTDTIDFVSASAQLNYFVAKSKYHFTDLTPIRLQNAIRVPVEADRLYDCNYIMFRNRNFDGKWFFAFITKINFINVNMSEIDYEIDAWQTWQFDIELHPSYIERMHWPTDNIGDNLVAEPVDIGEYELSDNMRTPYFDSYVAVIATAKEKTSTGKTGGYVGGMFSGLTYVAGLIDNPEQVENLLEFLQYFTDLNEQDSIVSTFVMPTDFYALDDKPVVRTINIAKNYEKIGRYVPKNKKLFTFPYNYLLATNSEGGSEAYRFEYFSTPACGLLMECGMGCDPQIILLAGNYANQTLDYEHTLTMSGFPQFGYAIDTYRAWLAQNANQFMLTTFAQTAALAGTTAAGNIPGAVAAATNLAGSLNNALINSNKGNTARGGAGGSNTLVACRQKNFYFYYAHVRDDYAEIIDDFFSMYGYAAQVVELPKLRTRLSWNYIKTRDCKITGSVPFDDIVKIKNMFNNGVTFWHGDYVGNYSRDNSPIGEIADEIL